jgi:hypothetical protein
MAKAIAKGASSYIILRLPKESPVEYVARLAKLRTSFPVLALVADEPETYQQGTEETMAFVGNLRSLASKIENRTGTGASLHKALADYITDLEKIGTPWGRTQVANAKRIKAAAKDRPLSTIGLVEMQDHFDHWRKRPTNNLNGQPIAKETAVGHVWQLKDFYDWTHKRSQKYEWKRPADCWEDIDRTVIKLPADSVKRNRSLQTTTYTIEELTILYQNASPLVRCMMLLAINCGFKQAEIGSLTPDEVFIETAHPHADELDFETSDSDSFIRRIRRKSEVYGEHWLFPETVEAIKWAMERRQGINAKSPALLLTSQGKSYSDETSGNNKPSRIRSLWCRIIKTVQETNPEFRSLPFSDLRKLGGNLVRSVSNGEISGVYLCHGQPVKEDQLSDIYTNRPFGKLVEALKMVREKLAPMFAGELQKQA